MGIKKYVKKQGGRVKRWAKNRYMPKGKVDVVRVAKDVAYVKSLLNVERKYNDYTVTNNLITDSTPYVYRLNGIAQGSGVTQRNGLGIRIKSLQHKIVLRHTQQTLANATLRVRLTWVVEKEIPTPGTDPLYTEVYTTQDPMGFRTWDGVSSRRFKIIHSKTILLSKDMPERQINVYKSMHLPVRWITAGAGATNNINENAMFLLISTDNTVSGELAMTSSHRITYVDN